MPALGELVKPLIDRPGNATALDAGLCQGDLDMRADDAVGAVERRGVGSCANATRYCLSWVGTKPLGTCEADGGDAEAERARREHGGRRQIALSRRRVVVRGRGERAVEAAEEPAEARDPARQQVLRRVDGP